VQYAVRFDRSLDSTGPDAVLITADRYAECYREGQLTAYQFFDVEGRQVALVRAAQVLYIAVAGCVQESQPDVARHRIAGDEPTAPPSTRVVD
jgi:hypothetical protein